MSKNKEIKIKESSSSLSEFVKRPLASDEEVEAFDRYAKDEAKEQEIRQSLKRIYQDDDGNQVDVKKLVVRPKRGWFFNFIVFCIVLFTLGGSVYAAYRYLYLKYYVNRESVSLSFTAPKEVAAGEEFFYELNYKNEDKVGLKNLEIKLTYPENFIFLSSEPVAEKNNDLWRIPALGSHRSDVIKIKGKLVGQLNGSNLAVADMTYTPENFSSEFKKSANFETKINDLGIDFNFLSSTNAQLNEENELDIKFKAKEQNYLTNFRLSLEHPAELMIIGLTGGQSLASSTAGLIAFPSGADAWLISNLGKNENTLKLKFKIKELKQPQVQLKLKFELPVKSADPALPDKYYLFNEQTFSYEIVKSDLNLNVIVNGSSLDQGVNFGQTLNYSLSYKNFGSSALNDVIIMAVLESDFLDWQTLNDAKNGKISGNAISWSKEEIPALASLGSGAEGVIDFSIKLRPLSGLDLTKAYQVKSYARSSIGGKTSAENQSNIIINKINSDLNFSEQLRYFNDDNIAVGSGPLPPRVGQTTSLKVYWNIGNSLNDLTNVKANLNLPAGINWDGKNRASIGALTYDPSARQVSWTIDRLANNLSSAAAEFNVSLTPTESDRGKIMVVLPALNLSAVDAATGANLSKTLKAKTTKLEDDSMATGDGVVQ